MFPHPRRRPSDRSPLRAAVLTSLLTAALLGPLALAGPAVADTPAAWEDAPEVSPLGFLLVLLILPVGAGLVIALLAVLPSLAGDKGYEPGQAWRGEAEWFGGPTKGLSAADQVTPQQIEGSSQGTGGTSGRW